MKSSVLLLNRNYEPINVVSAKKAIVLFVLQKVEIVEKHESFVRSVTFSIPFPSIIRLVRYAPVPRKRIILSRKNILKRDGNRCQYCGTSNTALTIDHVIPKNRKGVDSWENLVCACVKCNNKKGNRTPDEVGMRLLKQPRRPSQLHFIQHFVGISDQRWKPYLFMN